MKYLVQWFISMAQVEEGSSSKLLYLGSQDIPFYKLRNTISRSNINYIHYIIINTQFITIRLHLLYLKIQYNNIKIQCDI